MSNTSARQKKMSPSPNTNELAYERIIASVGGWVAVLGNIIAVAFLIPLESAYRLDGIDIWAQEVTQHPWLNTFSALAFWVGLVGIVLWARGMKRELNHPLADAGAWIVIIVCVGNAYGTLTPLVQAWHVGNSIDGSTNRALLGIAITFDAIFNLGLSIGFGLWAIVMRGHTITRWLTFLSAVAVLPVAGQAIWDPAANALAIAGPLWLLLIAKTSFHWMRNPRHASACY